MVQVYQVGGCVRDMIMNVRSKDIDFVVIANSYGEMKEYVAGIADIKVEKPEFVTIRAVHPEIGGVDYVLARKDGVYSDGRRPDTVEVGTLMDDLSRRDFRMNAIAMDERGMLIDPFSGREDIRLKIIRCVGDAHERISEDYLRLMRAGRFSITKGFYIYPDIARMFYEPVIIDRMIETVDFNRIRDEIMKMFRHSTSDTMRFFSDKPYLSNAIFSTGDIWLKPTSEER